jgi:hypothetical protein
LVSIAMEGQVNGTVGCGVYYSYGSRPKKVTEHVFVVEKILCVRR